MLKLRLVAGCPDRLAKLLDISDFEVETSRMNKAWEERDDSPVDEIEVIAGNKDD